jgi:hypothetical protein
MIVVAAEQNRVATHAGLACEGVARESAHAALLLPGGGTCQVK